MSRIGKKPVKIPDGVTISVASNVVEATGPKGKLITEFRPEIKIMVDGKNVLVERLTDTPKAKSLHGLYRTLVENMVIGVSQGWNKGLELVGVGYRVALEGTTLVLNLGYSHQIKVPPPQGITFEVMDNTKINIKGIDKQMVGQTAAQVRKLRPPEPYKGKGIKYVGEVIRRKAGKAAKAAGAAGAK
jgi:large subunit ribosomal protein L6